MGKLGGVCDKYSLIARFMGPTWGPSGAVDKTESPKNYIHNLCFVVHGCGLGLVNFAHILQFCLIYWGQDKMAANFLTTISNASSLMKIYKVWLRFHLSLSPRVQLTIFQHWFRKGLGAGQGTGHHLNQWRLVYWCIYASLSLND